MAESGLLVVEIVVPVVEAAVLELEVDVPDLVLATFPFPSIMIPRPSMQQLGSLSQQKLPSLHTATLGKKAVPVEYLQMFEQPVVHGKREQAGTMRAPVLLSHNRFAVHPLPAPPQQVNEPWHCVLFG